MRAAKRPAVNMFSMPTLGGEEQLMKLVGEYGGVERVMRDFRVSRELLGVWLSGRQEVPLTVLLALWWQGPAGFQQGFVESHWANQYNAFKVRQLEAVVAQVRELLGADHPALQLPEPERVGARADVEAIAAPVIAPKVRRKPGPKPKPGRVPRDPCSWIPTLVPAGSDEFEPPELEALGLYTVVLARHGVSGS